jgi:hypothetical protein
MKKICADCRFYTAPNSCGHSGASVRHAVTGQTPCHVERYPDHACGPDGLLWQAKIPLPRWKQIIKTLLKL